MKHIFKLFFLIVGFSLYSQSRETILEKVRAQYTASKPLQFSTSYNLYKATASKTIYDSYKGTYLKNTANDMYIKINDTEYLITKKVSLQVSNQEKIVLVSIAKNAENEEYSISKMLSLFDKGTVRDKKTYWEIELKGKSLSQLPYSKIIVNIGKDYFIQKQIFYYSAEMNFSKDYSKEDMQQPRLEIVFGKPLRTPVPSSKFEISQYFNVVNKKIKLNEKYSKYELIDQR